MKLDIERMSDEAIKEDVLLDMTNKTNESILSLQAFYFKIITEPETRTSSFRYKYAKVAFTTICEKIDDQDSLTNFAPYHRSKIAFEIANPVKEDDDYKREPKRNPASIADRRGSINTKTAVQIKRL